MATIPPGTDLSHIPLAPNPDGTPPNFASPENQAALVLAAGMPFATIIRKTARHIYDIPLSFIDESYVQRQFAINFIVGPTLWSSKAAILALYLRLFGRKVWLRYTAYAILVLTFLSYWANSPLAGAFCAPHHGDAWDLRVLQKCERLSVMGPIHGVVGLAADLLILVLPLPVIYSLHLPRPKKIGLFMVFLTGAFAVVASSVSMYYRVKIYTGADPFWDGPNILATVVLEGYITILVSCAPAISAFWVNTLTRTAFYCSLRSVLKLSWSSLRMASEDTSLAKGAEPVPQSEGLQKHQRIDHGYHELRDVA
ncbi:MAG: hypothetical protein Q9207_002199 [Kuettlingeria erythrocarpa]